MSKLKRALWFKGKTIRDGKTMFCIDNVVVDSLPDEYIRFRFTDRASRPKHIYFIMRDADTGEILWHKYNDKRRKKDYIVVACRGKE